MLSLAEQLSRGYLVCPATRAPLVEAQGTGLQTQDGSHRYSTVGGVPILLADPAVAEGYLAQQSGAMVAEYSRTRRSRARELYDRLTGAVGDLRAPASDAAFRSIFEGLPSDALCLSIGGGPMRAHPTLVNINIGLFPNVEVVADAYQLPYADACADAIHCEAVLEHLEFPTRAVEEMHRVLKPGGLAFFATPFLQSFHGYPDHYQNFTLTGHTRLFERAGFTVLAAGTCVGPTFAMRDLAVNYARQLIPGMAGKLVSRALALILLPLLYIDRWANPRSASSNLASTTFALVRRSSESAFAANSYWGTTKAAAIPKLILDTTDNRNLGKVLFLPFLKKPASHPRGGASALDPGD
jgi:SAM-dependent methyltransferase